MAMVESKIINKIKHIKNQEKKKRKELLESGKVYTDERDPADVFKTDLIYNVAKETKGTANGEKHNQKKEENQAQPQSESWKQPEAASSKC